MENKNDKKTKRLALAGQLCGATLLLTLLSIPLPSGYGYVNLGDAGVFLCACLLPGGLGALAAGVGAALADLILGWAMYAPVTLLIKGLTALLAGLALRRAGAAGRARPAPGEESRPAPVPPLLPPGAPGVLPLRDHPAHRPRGRSERAPQRPPGRHRRRPGHPGGPAFAGTN